ncbi:hypothetical protein ONZ45_g2587 [Pleurotus djamor]|nr:hypothetical protein ONZ45_g2587 [Pleurotus djamor]
MVENGLKVCYVFDGRPPDMKRKVLKERGEKRKEAEEGGEEAKEVGTAEDISRFTRRTVKVTPQHNSECQRLLKLMGIPFVIAPSEAEAQCAELARGGKVYASGSEDMDTLTFGSPILFRHLTFSEAKKADIMAVDLKKALEGLDMDMNMFIDLCLLLGCDYLDPIKGVGPSTAMKLIREHKGLKGIVAQLREKQAERAATSSKKETDDEVEDAEDEEADKPESEDEDEELKDDGAVHPTSDFERDPDATKDSDAEDSDAPKKSAKGKGKLKADDAVKGKSKGKKTDTKGKGGKGKGKGKGGIQIPEEWPWEEAKEMFKKPDVIPAKDVELEWKLPDVDGLVQFLVNEKGFNEERVRKGADKLIKFMNAKQQGRLDGFFTVKPKEPKPVEKPTKGGKGAKGAKSGVKRKGDDKAEPSKKRAKK